MSTRWLTWLRLGLWAGLLPVLKALRFALGLALLGARRAAVLGRLRAAVVKSLLRTLRRAGAVVAGEAEIHLFLEAVHLGDLHFHFVAEPNHAPVPPANELAAR